MNWAVLVSSTCHKLAMTSRAPRRCTRAPSPSTSRPSSLTAPPSQTKQSAVLKWAAAYGNPVQVAGRIPDETPRLCPIAGTRE
jgi:hypothetical protein